MRALSSAGLVWLRTSTWKRASSLKRATASGASPSVTSTFQSAWAIDPPGEGADSTGHALGGQGVRGIRAARDASRVEPFIPGETRLGAMYSVTGERGRARMKSAESRSDEALLRAYA